jgi:hypothetical protein
MPICARVDATATVVKELAQLQQGIERCAWRIGEPHQLALRRVEHPCWDVHAIPALVSDDKAPKDDQRRRSAFAADYELLTVERVPSILDATSRAFAVGLVGLVCARCTTMTGTT